MVLYIAYSDAGQFIARMCQISLVYVSLRKRYESTLSYFWLTLVQLRNSTWEIHFALFKQIKAYIWHLEQIKCWIKFNCLFLLSVQIVSWWPVGDFFSNICEGVGHQWCSCSLSVTDARTVDSLFIFIRWCWYLEQLLPRDVDGIMLFRCST